MERGNRKYQYLSTVALSVGYVTTGMIFSWTTIVLPKFQNNEASIQMTDSEISWVAGVAPIGIMAGSIATGYTSDKYGRRATVIGSTVPVLVASFIVIWAYYVWMVYVAKFLWGVGAGMVVTVGGIYIAEIADKDIRGTLAVAIRLCFAVGNLLMMCFGSYVYYDTLNYMLLALSVVYCVASWCIPESPYYYLKEGKLNAARKSLTKLRGYNDAKILEDELLSLQSDVKNEMRRSGSIKELFTGKQYRRAVIVVSGLKLSQMITGTLVISYYLGPIMIDGKSDVPLAPVFIAYGVLRFLAGIISSIISDKVGRRPLLVYSYIGAGAFLLLTTIYFCLQELTSIDQSLLQPYSIIIAVGLVASNTIAVLGYNSTLYVICAEIFPMNVKSVAMSFIYVYGGVTGFIVNKGYQHVKEITGLFGIFLVFTVTSFASAVFVHYVVPETRGKSLKEIQIELQGSLYDEGNLESGLKSGNCDENAKELQPLNK